MHGEIRPNDLRMSEESLDDEKKILQDKFRSLLRTKGQTTAPGGWADIIKEMIFESEETGGRMAPDNQRLPAAYSYFGQLLAHDISVHRFFGGIRPALRLRTLYGLGPMSSPQFFQHEQSKEDSYTFRAVKFVLDEYDLDDLVGGEKTEKVTDFIRISQQRKGAEGSIPLMADARNDQNFITSQLAIKFAELHNRLAERYYKDDLSEGYLFKQVSEELVKRYQKVIVTDYLPRILHRSVLDDEGTLSPLTDRNNFKIFKVTNDDGDFQECRLSEVFSRGVMRFGHSMVRQLYQVRLKRRQKHIFPELAGFKRDSKRKIDWICLLAEAGGKAFQPAKAIDTNIVLSLDNLPFIPKDNRSLIEKNVENSYQNFILGNDFKDALEGASIPALPEAILDKWKKAANGTVPLWIYILLEAEHLGDQGERLGPLGSQIVAEQIMWSLLDDPDSILRDVDEKGQPIPFDFKQKYTLKQLLEEAGENFGPEKESLMPDIWKNWKTKIESPSFKLPVNFSVASDISTTEARSRFLYHGDEKGLTFQQIGNPTHLLRLAYPSPVNNPSGQPTTQKPDRMVDIPFGEQGLQVRSDILNNSGSYLLYKNEENANGLKKTKIACYLSRTMILELFGNNSAITAPTGNDVQITGLFFLFGLKDTSASPSVCLLVRRTGINGVLPTGVNDLWIIDNQNITTDSSEATKRITLFGDDHFNVLKIRGLADQTFSGNALLSMLGCGTLAQDISITASLISTTGQEIADGEGYDIAADDATYVNMKDTPFFALALTSVTTPPVVVGPGRTYPPDCYPMSI